MRASQFRLSTSVTPRWVPAPPTTGADPLPPRAEKELLTTGLPAETLLSQAAIGLAKYKVKQRPHLFSRGTIFPPVQQGWQGFQQSSQCEDRRLEA